MSKPHRNRKFHRGWVGKFSTGGGNVRDTLGGWHGCGRGDKRTNERTDKQMGHQRCAKPRHVANLQLQLRVLPDSSSKVKQNFVYIQLYFTKHVVAENTTN